jgi:lipoprotein-releasing system permease protein
MARFHVPLSWFLARKVIRSGGIGGGVGGPMIRMATISLVLGLVVMLISMASGRGLQREIKHKVIGFTGDLRIVALDANESLEPSPIPDSGEYLLAPSLQDAGHMQRFAQKAGIIRTKETLEGAVLKGVGPEFRWDFFESYLQEGQSFSLQTADPNDSVWISQQLGRLLQLKLGDRFTMYFIRKGASMPQRRNFTIAGIYQTGLEEFDKAMVICDLRQIQRLSGWDSTQIAGWEVFLNHPEQTASLVRDLDAELPYDLKAESAAELNPQLFQWLDLFDFNVVLITGILLVVALINLSTALLVIILDRTRMVGILQALGAERSSIRSVFQWIALRLVGRGLLWGNVLGCGLIFLQQSTGILTLDPENYYVESVPMSLSLWGWLGINAIVAVTSWAALWIPAWFATRINPVLALRFS